MILSGNAFVYGDNIDTDLIIAARYLTTSDPAQLAKHAMEDADAAFAQRVQPGDFVVAGENFGCGSSREHAPVALKAAGVGAVIARSYARIFYRNAFNTGLLILDAPDMPVIAPGTRLVVDMDTGVITPEGGAPFAFTPIPPFMREILDAGGLMAHASHKAVA